MTDSDPRAGEIRKLVKRGFTDEAIGAELALTRHQVSNLRKKYDIPSGRSYREKNSTKASTWRPCDSWERNERGDDDGKDWWELQDEAFEAAIGERCFTSYTMKPVTRARLMPPASLTGGDSSLSDL